MDEFKVRELTVPVTENGLEIRSIRMRRMKGGDLLVLDELKEGNSIATCFKLASRLTGLLPMTIEAMEAEDVAWILEQLGDFVPGGLGGAPRR